MIDTARPSIGLCAQLACVLDVVARKPGNVHTGAGFSDMTALDFLASGAAIAPVLETATSRRVGETILECVRRTRQVTSVNTNLGIILLLAPLASVCDGVDLRSSVARVLSSLDVPDAVSTYKAIRLAKPGGLGSTDSQDVAEEPTVTLRQAMALAADRDLIARQYVTDFATVFDGVDMLTQLLSVRPNNLAETTTRLFLHFLARWRDSHIERKYGDEIASEVTRRAHAIVDNGAVRYSECVQEFDAWLRSAAPGPLNPGTTADLVTACLFVAFRERIIELPFARPLLT